MSSSSVRSLELYAIRDIMQTEQGRRFMWRMLEVTRFNDTVFATDHRAHARNEGMREVGHWLMSEIKEAAKGSYIKMIEENDNA